jgi:hypothetical protein
MRAFLLAAIAAFGTGCALTAAGEDPRLDGDAGAPHTTPDAGHRKDAGKDAGAPRDAHADVARSSADGSHVDASGPPMPGDTGADSPRDSAAPVDAPVDAGQIMEASSPDAHSRDVGAPDVGVSHPQSCAAANATSGTVTLYVNGNPAKPWQATCVGTTSYLTLTSKNYSSYPANGSCTTGAGVVTTWTRVNVDPITLLVNTVDYSGATSVNATHEVSGDGTVMHDYIEMPYGSARTCVQGAPNTAGTPGAVIDLTGTPFAIGGSSVFAMAGYQGSSSVAPTAGGPTVDLFIGGYPAGISPCAGDYYTDVGGACLQLLYVGP